MVKVTPHGRHTPRRIEIHPWCSSWACLRRWPWPTMVSLPHLGQRRGSSAKGNAFTPDRTCLVALAMR